MGQVDLRGVLRYAIKSYVAAMLIACGLNLGLTAVLGWTGWWRRLWLLVLASALAQGGLSVLVHLA